MKNSDMKNLVDGIQTKLGKENAGLILDDLTTILTDNNAMNEESKTKDSTIKQLKDDKERLITVNGNLMQKISVGVEETIETKRKEKEEVDNNKYNIKDAFDSKGNFI